jgi:DNA adenine methylase
MRRSLLGFAAEKRWTAQAFFVAWLLWCNPTAITGNGMSSKIPQSIGYLGSKASDGSFQRIIGQMRPHDDYVETCFGSGQIFWRKKFSARSFLIDKAPGPIAIFNAGRSALPDGHEFFASIGCGIGFLQRSVFTPRTVIYIDPPYLLSTRSSRYRYTHEMTDNDHERLLTVVQLHKCDILISGYPSALYEKYLKKWRVIRYKVRTRGGTKIECLWMNFSEPDELHDWRYAGKNFRQRLYLNRMKKRWLGKLERMTPRQRGFILDAIEQRRH